MFFLNHNSHIFFSNKFYATKTLVFRIALCCSCLNNDVFVDFWRTPDFETCLNEFVQCFEKSAEKFRCTLLELEYNFSTFRLGILGDNINLYNAQLAPKGADNEDEEAEEEEGLGWEETLFSIFFLEKKFFFSFS